MNTLKHIEKRAAAIFHARKTAAELSEASEQLRTKIDALDNHLRATVETGAIDQETFERLIGHVERIRRARNGMECFAAECAVREEMEKAWRELP